MAQYTGINKYKIISWACLIILVLSIFHNIMILSMYSLPGPAADKRLSSHIVQNEKSSGFKYELFDRIEKNAVQKEFINICKDIYRGKTVNVSGDYFSGEILMKAGFDSVSNKDHINSSSLNTTAQAYRSLFYNPLVFSSVDYKKTERYPFRTEPELKKNYPYVILFFDTGKNYDLVDVFVEDRYIIFSPEL